MTGTPDGGDGAGGGPTPPPPAIDETGEAIPAVPVEQSVQRNFLVCLETGGRKVMLRRHLKESLGMTADEYREKWGLPKDYPMVAPAYAERRDAVTGKKKA